MWLELTKPITFQKSHSNVRFFFVVTIICLSLYLKSITMTLNQNQLNNAQETLDDFKVLLMRYKEVKNDEIKLKSFFVRNRNPLWDLTGCKFYKTGVLSEGAKKVEPTRYLSITTTQTNYC